MLHVRSVFTGCQSPPSRGDKDNPDQDDHKAQALDEPLDRMQPVAGKRHAEKDCDRPWVCIFRLGVLWRIGRSWHAQVNILFCFGSRAEMPMTLFRYLQLGVKRA